MLYPIKQNEEILQFFLILPYFLYFIILISRLQKYYISSDPQIIPHIFYTYPLFFVLNQPFSTKKGGHPP